MRYSVKWTETAQQDYLDIIDYLLKNWGIQPAKKFKESVANQLHLISSMPKMYPKTIVKNGVRRCLVVKQVSMYYVEFEIDKEIIVVRFRDNRRNPDDLSEALKEGES